MTSFRSSLWQSLFGGRADRVYAYATIPTRRNDGLAARGRGRTNRLARRVRLEKLEDRRLLAADLYANDNWHFFSDVDLSNDLSIGDLVSNANDSLSPGAIVKAYGSEAFGEVTSGTYTGSVVGAATLQDAVNAASLAGDDTLHVLEGTYVLSSVLLIDRGLTLVGAQQGVDARTRSGVESTLVADTSGAIDVSAALTDTITIDGLSFQSSSAFDVAIDFNINFSVFARNNIIDGFLSGIEVGADGDVTIQGNKIDVARVGIGVDGVAGSLQVGGFGAGEGNWIDASDEPDNGVGVGAGNVFGNSVISGNQITSSFVGIQSGDVLGTTTIQGNTIDAVGIGIDASRSGTTTTGAVLVGGTGVGEGNTITGTNWAGVQAVLAEENEVLQIVNNQISGVVDNSFGDPFLRSAGIWLLVSGTATNPVLISGNQISGAGSDIAGIRLDFATATIQSNNEISGFLIGIDVNNGSAALISGNRLYQNDSGIVVSNAGTISSLASNNFVDALLVAADNDIDVQLLAGAEAVVFGNGNAFHGDTYFIDNQDDQDVDLSALAGTTFDETSNFRIEDKIFHALDSVTSGLVRVVADQLFVTAPGTGASDESFLAAIIAADAGDTINIEGGTYNENLDTTASSVTIAPGGSGTATVTINGTLTLSADDTLAVTINSLSVYDKLVVSGVASLGNSTLAAAGSYVPAVGDSFTIIDTAGGVVGTFSNSIVILNGVPATIQYTPDDVLLVVIIPTQVWVNDTWIVTNDTGPAGLSAGDTVSSNVGAGDTLVIGKIFGYDAFSTLGTGLTAVATSGTVHVLRGTYAGGVSVGKHVTIAGQGDSVTTLSGGGTVGITVQSGFNVNVSGLKVQNFSVGLQVNGHLTMSSSTVTGGLNGIMVTGGVLDLASSIVRNALLAQVAVLSGIANITTSEFFSTGLSLVGILISGGQTSILNSIITDNVVGIAVTGGTVTVHDSNLAGNSLHAIQNYTSNTVNAEGNWWGSNQQRRVRDEILGNVDFTPWLATGVDIDGGARGFDGV